jgi:RND superfamily putative drug exporter
VWVVTALILGVLALGLTGLRADGLSTAASFTGTPESVSGQQLLAQHFPAGAGSPVIVISNAAEAAPVRQALATTPGIVATTQPVVRGDHAYMEGTLGAPPDSKAAQDIVDRVRSAVHAVPGAQAKAGGNTAVQLGIQRASRHDNLVVIPLVLTVVLVILGALRALVAPLVLIATVVLSYAAALGVSVFAFRHLFHFDGEDSAFPLFVFVFLVALGVDYNIFLMPRVREESQRLGTRAGARAALAAMGGVITSAGLILASTFGVLGTLPVVGFGRSGSQSPSECSWTRSSSARSWSRRSPWTWATASGGRAHSLARGSPPSRRATARPRTLGRRADARSGRHTGVPRQCALIVSEADAGAEASSPAPRS